MLSKIQIGICEYHIKGSAGICKSDNYRAYGESIFRMEAKSG